MPSRRIVSTMLLVAMGLQGLTPDPRDLSSTWLLGVLAPEGSATRPVNFGPAPIQVPGPTDHDDGGPGELCMKIDLAASLRARFDSGVARFFLVLERTPNPGGTPGPRGPVRSPSAVERWADGLIPVLCRFLC